MEAGILHAAKKENALMMLSLKRHLISMSDPRYRLLSVFGYILIAILKIDDVPCFYQPRGVIPIAHEGLDEVQNNAVVQFSCASASLS
jgi:hypothetical protein